MERFLKSRYKIGDKISDNSFSVTYKGSFLSSNKSLIIKIYKRGTLNSLLINQMKRKVKELSLINHHGVAKLIDGDYGWQGFYYVREFIEGRSLQEILRSGEAVGVDKAVTIVEEICLALEQAHAKDIVHGALRPSNVFLDKKGVVKVADFVIEGQIKEAMPQKALAIMDDGRYASPEELAGSAASAASDIYALGLLLYELATNQPAVKTKGLASGLKKLRRAPLIDQEPLKDKPRYLQEIINKALQPDPLQRFSSAAEFRQSLEQKHLIAQPSKNDMFVNIFEQTVTQYGGEEVDRNSEMIREVGQVKLRWGKEKHRNWILTLVLAAALITGLIYAFMFGR